MAREREEARRRERERSGGRVERGNTAICENCRRGIMPECDESHTFRYGRRIGWKYVSSEKERDTERQGDREGKRMTK